MVCSSERLPAIFEQDAMITMPRVVLLLVLAYNSCGRRSELICFAGGLRAAVERRGSTGGELVDCVRLAVYILCSLLPVFLSVLYWCIFPFFFRCVYGYRWMVWWSGEGMRKTSKSNRIIWRRKKKLLNNFRCTRTHTDSHSRSQT